MSPRLLDLFCGAGGAAVGYRRAGFDVVGVDLRPQPRYPFTFHQADALTFDLAGFDVVHASPPCQRWSALNKQLRRPHPDLIGPTRDRLVGWGGPWIMENVPGAPLRADVLLCGRMFGLGVKRHRLFETWDGYRPWTPFHDDRGPFVGVYGHPGGTHRRRPGESKGTTAEWREAMGIDWMTAGELAQAIPPAYTEWIALEVLARVPA